MNRLIFVHHPNNEPRYQINQRVQIIPWNCERHKRKLIRHDGIFLNQGKVDYAPLYFWGEYEPYSCAHVYRELPAIHDDLKSVRNMNITPIAYMQNTDPYVFGSRFRYICCNKTGKLNPGDIVLFGHYDGKTNFFYFDTVFVCRKDGVPIQEDFENQYYLACARPANIKKYAEGVMYKDDESMFSFVPCRIGTWDSDEIETNMAFSYLKLPYVNIKDFGLKSFNKRNKNTNVFFPEYWKMIISAVEDAHLCFGIHLAEI